MSTTKIALVVHGTRSPTGQKAYRQLTDTIAKQLAQVDVDICYLDVQQPLPEDIFPHQKVIYVPLLLNTGYHAHKDLQSRIKGRWCTITESLGPNVQFFGELFFRVFERYSPRGHIDEFIIGVSSSSSLLAQQENQQLAQYLVEKLERPVTVIPIQLDISSEQLVNYKNSAYIFHYFLIPGLFYKKLAATGIPSTQPLWTYPEVQERIIQIINNALSR